MRILIIALAALAVFAAPSPARAGTGFELTWPVDGRVTRAFDSPESPYGAGHRGVDVVTTGGTVVVAAASGRVLFSGRVAGRGTVSVDHGNGWRTTYQPVSPWVPEGATVAAGDVLGRLLPGHCAATCLHWGLTDGETYLDPTGYLAMPVIRLLPRGSVPEPLPTLPAAVVSGTPVAGRVTSPFGMRRHPVTGVVKLHDGVDYAAACGTPVVAPSAGVVVSASFDGAYGYRVRIDHGGGVVMGYAHLQGLTVRAGASLDAGAALGTVGSTGLSTGCHLHWMAWRDGTLINPATLA